jgi:bacterioferritin-associated ferredoxin
VYVCLCRAVSSDTICQLIDAGVDSAEAIASTCGAGTRCGRCQVFIEDMLQERPAYTATQVTLPIRPACAGTTQVGDPHAWSRSRHEEPVPSLTA